MVQIMPKVSRTDKKLFTSSLFSVFTNKFSQRHICSDHFSRLSAVEIHSFCPSSGYSSTFLALVLDRCSNR